MSRHHDLSVYDPDDRGPVRGNRRHYKGGSGSSTTTTQLPSWMKPYQSAILNLGQNLANRPWTPYTGQRVAGFTPDEQQAFGMIRDQATQGSAGVNSADRMLAQTMRGKFLGANPYLDKIVGRAQDITAQNFANGTAAQTDAAAARAGAFGNSGYFQQVQNNADTLGQNLGDIATNMYGQSYENERANMLRAAALAPGVAQARYMPAQMLSQAGTAQRAMQQGLLDVDYNNFLDEQNWPVQNLGILSNALGAAAGGTGVTIAQGPQSQTGGLQGALGGALSGAATGSMISPGWGTAIGAGIGGLLGLF